MLQIKELAPTITDAVKAVEMGCRKVQDDAHFKPGMLYWMAIKENVCYGCLATATLLQLTNKTDSDVVNHFSAHKVFVE